MSKQLVEEAVAAKVATAENTEVMSSLLFSGNLRILANLSAVYNRKLHIMGFSGAGTSILLPELSTSVFLKCWLWPWKTYYGSLHLIQSFPVRFPACKPVEATEDTQLHLQDVT